MQTCHTNTKIVKKLIRLNYFAVFSELYWYQFVFARSFSDVVISYTNV